jgi:hypothetical protein
MKTCKICQKELKGNLGISKHLSNSHPEISRMQYVLTFEHNGIRPTCECGCGGFTNFESTKGFKFRKFLKGHKTEEMKRIIRYISI